MPTQYRSRRRTGSIRRPKFYWQTFDFAATVAIGGQTFGNLMLDIDADKRPGMVIVRVIANLNIIPSVATSSIDWTFGIGLVDKDAQVGGLIPSPTSANNGQMPWMYSLIQTTSFNAGFQGTLIVPVDTKASRKITGRGDPLFSFNNRGSSSDSVVTAFSGRALYRLP